MNQPSPKPLTMIDKIERRSKQKGLAPARPNNKDLLVYRSVVKPTRTIIVLHRFTQRSPTLLRLEAVAHAPVPSERLAEATILLRQKISLPRAALSLTPTNRPGYVRFISTTVDKLTTSMIDGMYSDVMVHLDGLMSLSDE